MTESPEANDPDAFKLVDLGPLHALLLLAAPTAKAAAERTPRKDAAGELILPKFPQRRSISTLARALGVPAWTIYLWVKKGRLTPVRAKQVVEISEGRVTADDIRPFVYIPESYAAD